MTTQDFLWERLTLLHPTPWYLERDNLNEVEVKDNRGNTVYYEDLGCIPDEMANSQAAAIQESADILGRFLVELSNNQTVNCHDDLLEACKGALALITDNGTQGGKEWTIKALRSAIDRATTQKAGTK